MKALVGAFNREKVLVGAFSVIVTADRSFAALLESYLLYLSVVSLGTSPPGLEGVPLVSICKNFAR